MPSRLCQYTALCSGPKAVAGDREMPFSSATSACSWGESHAGGGGTRNSPAEVSRKGFQPGVVTLAGFVPTQLQGPVGTVPVQTASEPSDLAYSITFAATCLPNCMPAE